MFKARDDLKLRKERAVLYLFGALLLLFVNPRALNAAAPQYIVRNVRVEVRALFDEPDAGSFYRTVNSLKVSTREDVVRRELLLRPGDAYDHFLLEESERALRALPFLRQVSITPFFDGDQVDLTVSVQDTWTLYPALSFASGGGTSRQSVSLVESNLFGLGKRLELLYADDEGRRKVEGIWDDRRMWGTKQRLLLGRFERSDGYRSLTYYGEPYQNLSDENSWSTNSDVSNLVGRRFENGTESFIYRQKHESFGGNISAATGDPEILVRRYSAGYEYIRDSFRMPDAQDFEDVDVDPDSVREDPNMLADNRRFSGPFLGYEQVEPDFVSFDYIDRFDRVEDFNLGEEWLARLHVAPRVFGSEENTLLFSFNRSDGVRLSSAEFLRGELGGGTRLHELDSFQNSMLHGELIYVNRLGRRFAGIDAPGYHTLLSSFAIDASAGLDLDRQYLLGASTGLRGYEDRALSGSQRLVLNVEDRVHLVEDLFRLVSLGGVAFFDAGAAGYNNMINAVSDEFRTDVGIGLRFGFPRSSGGGIVRVDLAFPLRDGPEGTHAFEPRLLISTGQVFNARLRSETLGPERVDLSIFPGS